ncbi:MAG: GNAT family N-acetyltransferase [Ruminococcaceae bacterium]|nr:GNAT family N-acetyltransferase [Oscillospiraceae bacterium]
MKTVIYDGLNDHAIEVRQKVFVEEQGFHDEFDEIDKTASHIIFFDEEKPVAVCRVFWDPAMNSYILGRLAVLKEYRGRNLGSDMVREAEKHVLEKGGNSIALHAQCRVTAFYRSLGYGEYGEIEDDEGCPHIWMKKSL